MPSLRRLIPLALALLCACASDAAVDATGGGPGGNGAGGANGGGTGGNGAAPTCGPQTPCEDGLVCDVNRDECVECLTSVTCESEEEVCIDGVCEARLCLDDSECPADMPSCTDTGCEPCEGTVAVGNETGDCYLARGPSGQSPQTNLSDGCSAQKFVEVLESLNYDIPSDEGERKAIADNPLETTTGGACSVQFGNNGAAISACEIHDYCYSTCQASRSQCDLEFAKRLLETCDSAFIPGPCLTACRTIAVAYGTKVARDPDGPYINNQGLNCACCPDRTLDGQCSEDEGESVYNSKDCTGELPDGSRCFTDRDCASNHCSLHGECTPALCVTNSACPSGICNQGICLERRLPQGSACTTDAACESFACTLGTCLACQSDDQCPTAQHCNLIGNCVDDLGNNAVCTSDGECLSNICSAGFCAECVRDSQCPSSQHCNLVGDCVNDLGNNAACTGNGECRSNICSAGFCAECVRDSQCPSSQHCNLVGDCINDLDRGALCTANAECKSGRCRGICI